MLLRRVWLVMFHKAAGAREKAAAAIAKNHFKQKQQGKCTKRLRALQFPSSQLHVRTGRCVRACLCACVCVRMCVSQCLPTFASLTGNFRRLVHSHPLVIDCNMSALVCSSLTLLYLLLLSSLLLLLLPLLFGNNFLTLW